MRSEELSNDAVINVEDPIKSFLSPSPKKRGKPRKPTWRSNASNGRAQKSPQSVVSISDEFASSAEPMPGTFDSCSITAKRRILKQVDDRLKAAVLGILDLTDWGSALKFLHMRQKSHCCSDYFEENKIIERYTSRWRSMIKSLSALLVVSDELDNSEPKDLTTEGSAEIARSLGTSPTFAESPVDQFDVKRCMATDQLSAIPAIPRPEARAGMYGAIGVGPKGLFRVPSATCKRLAPRIKAVKAQPDENAIPTAASAIAQQDGTCVNSLTRFTSNDRTTESSSDFPGQRLAQQPAKRRRPQVSSAAIKRCQSATTANLSGQQETSLVASESHGGSSEPSPTRQATRTTKKAPRKRSMPSGGNEQVTTHSAELSSSRFPSAVPASNDDGRLTPPRRRRVNCGGYKRPYKQSNRGSTATQSRADLLEEFLWQQRARAKQWFLFAEARRKFVLAHSQCRHFMSFLPKPTNTHYDALADAHSKRDAANDPKLTVEKARAVLQIVYRGRDGGNVDPWLLLGVERPRDERADSISVGSSKLKEVKRAYRSWARHIHPDKNSHPLASEAFQIIDKAWRSILTQMGTVHNV